MWLNRLVVSKRLRSLPHHGQMVIVSAIGSPQWQQRKIAGKILL
jgi:hypothetical protein